MPIPNQRPAWADMLDYLSLRIAQRIQAIFGFVIDNRMETYQYAVSVALPVTQALAYARGTAATGIIAITGESDFVATAFSGLEEILLADTGGTPTFGATGATAAASLGLIAVSPTHTLNFTLGAAGAAAGPMTQFATPQMGPGAWDYLITDGGNDRQMSNQAIHAHAGVGVGMFPKHLPKPRLFKRNTNIRIAFTLRHGQIGNGTTLGEQMNVQFVIDGYKVYDRSALDLTERV